MFWKRIRNEAWDVLRESFASIRRRWPFVLAALAVGFSAAAALYAWADVPVIEAVETHRPGHPGLRQAASVVRDWGNFIDTPVIFACVYALGLALRSRRVRLAGLACLLSGCLAGASANVPRFLVGRARPTARSEQEFHGPTLVKYKHQSFPSGHAATSVGNAVGLAVALPPAAVPALLSGAGVAVASIYTRSHYPSDILFGSTIGILWGIIVGMAARRRASREDEAGGVEKDKERMCSRERLDP